MQSQLKVLAPVITRDVTLPNSSKKVPMVMVHVPDSQTIMAIPLSTLSQMSTNTTTTSTNTTTTTASTGTGATLLTTNSPKDEQQAKDLLNWSDGIGTLDGCDLRFKINQLGCLELLDSDDESNLEHLANSKQQTHANWRQSQPSRTPPPYLNQQHCQDDAPTQNVQEPQHNRVNLSNTGSSNTSSSSASLNNTTTTANNFNGTNSANLSGAKKQTNRIKQISPGSSLLRDGPDNRRSRASSSSTTPTPTATNNCNNTNVNNNGASRTSASGMPLSKKHESNQQTFLLEKLIPKNKLDEIKAVVENWSIDDVKAFVDSIPGCAGNGQLFESQQICGKSLMYLDQKDLIDIINIKLGPAIKIYNAISLIKP